MADAWSEGEKSMLLMQILDQVKPEKGGINWDLINLPGRTKKACQNTWHKFTAHHKQQMEGLGDKNGGNTPSPAKAKGTPASRKRKPKKEQVKAEEEDDDEDAPTPTKKPRGRARKPKLEDDIQVPQPRSLEEVNQDMFPQGDIKPKAEDYI